MTLIQFFDRRGSTSPGVRLIPMGPWRPFSMRSFPAKCDRGGVVGISLSWWFYRVNAVQHEVLRASFGEIGRTPNHVDVQAAVSLWEANYDAFVAEVKDTRSPIMDDFNGAFCTMGAERLA